MHGVALPLTLVVANVEAGSLGALRGEIHPRQVIVHAKNREDVFRKGRLRHSLPMVDAERKTVERLTCLNWFDPISTCHSARGREQPDEQDDGSTQHDSLEPTRPTQND